MNGETGRGDRDARLSSRFSNNTCCFRSAGDEVLLIPPHSIPSSTSEFVYTQICPKSHESFTPRAHHAESNSRDASDCTHNTTRPPTVLESAATTVGYTRNLSQKMCDFPYTLCMSDNSFHDIQCSPFPTLHFLTVLKHY